MDGIIIFYKPKGITSHGVVSFFRKLLNIKKIGHTGTLDPNAEGVLPICIGKATRVSEYLLTEDKEYIGKLVLGKSTDTQDKYGTTIKTSSKKVSADEIQDSFNKFRGNILQTPPMYSSLKHNGKKLYELAREGKTIERQARNITIYELNIENIYKNKEVSFYVKCSKGSYIRTLCNDIGEDLGTFGYMSDLLRVGVGPFKIENAYKKEQIENLSISEIKKIILPIDSGLMKFRKIEIPSEFFNKLINGVRIEINNSEYQVGDILRVYSKHKFIGIGEIIRNDYLKLLKMNKVFA